MVHMRRRKRYTWGVGGVGQREGVSGIVCFRVRVRVCVVECELVDDGDEQVKLTTSTRRLETDC
jgi:hypothetical protein